MARAQAGQASLREALLAAVERSGKLDPLIVALGRPKRNRARYRAKRAAAGDGRTGQPVATPRPD